MRYHVSRIVESHKRDIARALAVLAGRLGVSRHLAIGAGEVDNRRSKVGGEIACLKVVKYGSASDVVDD